MKIDKVIMSCNDNPFYSDYWPVVSRVWKEKIGVEPVLVYFGDASKLSQEYGTVVEMEKIESVPIYTQAQWGRFWYTQFEPETMWLISDIDMLPMNRDYFVTSVVDMPREIEPYVHYNTNAEFNQEIEEWKLVGDCIHGGVCIPTCYSAGSGKLRKEMLDLVPSLEDSINNLKWEENDYNHAPDGVNGCAHWYAEEAYQGEKTKEWIASNPDKFFTVNRPGGFCSNRLDRGHDSMPEWDKQALEL